MSNASSDGGPWKKTACILCSINCGIEAQTGGEGGRRILKVHGDQAHPNSKGYLCEKAQRLDHYQNGADRLRSPMRRRPDGTYEEISWDTAIREVAAKLCAVRDRHGGASILYYGGGGQGNHLGGAYCDATLKALGVQFRSNALAQEKTGEFWVQGKMFGTGAHGDFERCEVAVFIGKNPWQSHGFARARAVVNEIAKDPARTLIVIDPRRSETAAKADIHLAIKPGTDAWCLAALVAIVVQEKLANRPWLDAHTTGFDEVRERFEGIDVAEFARTCGVEEPLLREAARRIAKAKSASVLEDLGLQMTVHSTLSSYLQRLVWTLAGHYGREGTSNAFVPFLSLSKASKGEAGVKGKGRPRVEKKSPLERAGFNGPAPRAANALFDAMLANPSGLVFAESDYDDSWNAITMADHKINLRIPELLEELSKLSGATPPKDPEFPWILAAGERRSDTSNTAVRDPSWHKRGRFGTLRMHPEDAARLGCADGERVRVVTRRGSVEVELELSDTMARGSVSLPNGQGLDYRAADGSLVHKGVAPNELTDNQSRDFLAGTPWHKYVPARVERVASSP
jgi:anaerobic selenocysteine-containing dehydrogenase